MYYGNQARHDPYGQTLKEMARKLEREKGPTYRTVVGESVLGPAESRPRGGPKFMRIPIWPTGGGFLAPICLAVQGYFEDDDD